MGSVDFRRAAEEPDRAAAQPRENTSPRQDRRSIRGSAPAVNGAYTLNRHGLCPQHHDQHQQQAREHHEAARLVQNELDRSKCARGSRQPQPVDCRVYERSDESDQHDVRVADELTVIARSAGMHRPGDGSMQSAGAADTHDRIACGLSNLWARIVESLPQIR